MPRKTLSPQPPAHCLGAHKDRRELEEAGAQPAIPPRVRPPKQEPKHAVSQLAVQLPGHNPMHQHHERNKCVDAEHDPKRGRRYDLHELQVELVDEWACVHCWCKAAKDADFLAKVGALLLRQCDKGLRGALAMCDERQFGEAA